MVVKKGRNINTNDDPDVFQVVLNSTTSTVLSAPNPDRSVFIVNNDSNHQIFVKLQAASVDNDKKGSPVYPGGEFKMPDDQIYPGEISAIAKNSTPTIDVTEY